MVTQECAYLEKDVQRTLEVSKDVLLYERDTPHGRGLVCKLFMDRQSMLRNKRCLLAYHNHRIGKLKDIYWDLGSGGLGGEPPESARKLMSQDEVAFYRDYAKLILDYSDSVGGDNMGLTTQTLQPPKDIFICVRVVKEVGSIVTTDGRTVDLPLGVQTFVERNHVEHLIMQGLLVQVKRPNQGQYGA